MISKPKSMIAVWMESWLAQGKGGRGTRQRAHSTFVQFDDIATKGRWGNVTPENITLRQAKKYVQQRIQAEISIRSIESELSAIRKAMRGAGRKIDANNWSRERLGLPPASRKGSGFPMPDEVLSLALMVASRAIRACIVLIEVLGLRQNELVECRDSLVDWERALRIGGPSIELIAGAKGGRTRVIFILAEHRAAAYFAVVEMLAITDGGKEHPIREAASGGAAVDKFSKELAKIGIKADYSCHSLRRRFALRQYRGYLKLGFEPRVALKRLALDLGHGEKRGRWVLNNYLINALTEEEMAPFARRGRPPKVKSS